jgi:hypothetical protein
MSLLTLLLVFSAAVAVAQPVPIPPRVCVVYGYVYESDGSMAAGRVIATKRTIPLDPQPFILSQQQRTDTVRSTGFIALRCLRHSVTYISVLGRSSCLGIPVDPSAVAMPVPDADSVRIETILATRADSIPIATLATIPLLTIEHGTDRGAVSSVVLQGPGVSSVLFSGTQAAITFSGGGGSSAAYGDSIRIADSLARAAGSVAAAASSAASGALADALSAQHAAHIADSVAHAGLDSAVAAGIAARSGWLAAGVADSIARVAIARVAIADSIARYAVTVARKVDSLGTVSHVLAAHADSLAAHADALIIAHAARTDNPHSTGYAQVGADPAGAAATVQGNLTTHTGNTSNPHNVTAAQIGAITTELDPTVALRIRDSLALYNLLWMRADSATIGKILDMMYPRSGGGGGDTTRALPAWDGQTKTANGIIAGLDTVRTKRITVGDGTRPVYWDQSIIAGYMTTPTAVWADKGVVVGGAGAFTIDSYNTALTPLYLTFYSGLGGNLRWYNGGCAYFGKPFGVLKTDNTWPATFGKQKFTVEDGMYADTVKAGAGGVQAPTGPGIFKYTKTDSLRASLWVLDSAGCVVLDSGTVCVQKIQPPPKKNAGVRAPAGYGYVDFFIDLGNVGSTTYIADFVIRGDSTNGVLPVQAEFESNGWSGRYRWNSKSWVGVGDSYWDANGSYSRAVTGWDWSCNIMVNAPILPTLYSAKIKVLVSYGANVSASGVLRVWFQQTEASTSTWYIKITDL